MSWSNAYIGLPYRDQGRDSSGVDCWGLARLVYLKELGITLPSFTEHYVSAEESAEAATLIAAHAAPNWRSVPEPRPFDLLLFRQGPHASHIGIAVQDGAMLHVQGNDQAKIESYRTGRWKPRLMGFYRHVKHPVHGGLT